MEAAAPHPSEGNQDPVLVPDLEKELAVAFFLCLFKKKTLKIKIFILSNKNKL